MLTSAQCRPRRRQQDARSAPTEKCHFAALLPLVVLLAAGVPALAADSIEELLHQDEADSFASVPASVVVVDTGNYYPRQRDGQIVEIESGMPESRWVEQKLGRPVIKAVPMPGPTTPLAAVLVFATPSKSPSIPRTKFPD